MVVNILGDSITKMLIENQKMKLYLKAQIYFEQCWKN